MREPVDERAVFAEAERRLEEVLLREPAVVARRVRVAVAVRRVRERPFVDLVARVERPRALGVPLEREDDERRRRVPVVPVVRELDLRLLVAMV